MAQVRKTPCWEKLSFLRLTEGSATVINDVKTTEEDGDKSGNGRETTCIIRWSTEPKSDRAKPEKNGVHFRGLLLYAGSAAYSGAYFLRYLARKYTPRRR